MGGLGSKPGGGGGGSPLSAAETARSAGPKGNEGWGGRGETLDAGVVGEAGSPSPSSPPPSARRVGAWTVGGPRLVETVPGSQGSRTAPMSAAVAPRDTGESASAGTKEPASVPTGAGQGEASVPDNQRLDAMLARSPPGGPTATAAKTRFRNAVTAVVETQRLDKSGSGADKMMASIRLASLKAGLKGATDATRQAASAALATLNPSAPSPLLSEGDVAKLKSEWAAIDKENRGYITVHQLEKLLQKRAYHTRKVAWKEEQRKKHRAQSWGDSVTSGYGAHFNYTGSDNQKDRAASMMRAKAAFAAYDIGGEGMGFETFCHFQARIMAKAAAEQVHDVSSWNIAEPKSPSASFKSNSNRFKSSQSFESQSQSDSVQSSSFHSRSFSFTRGQSFDRSFSSHLPKFMRLSNHTSDASESRPSFEAAS